MRTIQLIDSLETGGAERMAVNYANALVTEIEFSGLVATRHEGDLKKQLDANLDYLFLNRKGTFDLKAILRLRKYIKANKVDIIHAHSSSFFIAVAVKIFYPKVKIVWHDHNGNRVHLPLAGNKKIIFFSSFFNGVIACNTELAAWSMQNLKTKKVVYIPNFTSAPVKEQQLTFLKGVEGKRIVCLANLRNPKNHITLLRAFAASNAINADWTLHLIGKDNGDTYASELKNFVRENGMEHNVFFYGSCSDIFSVLKQSDIGVLVSTSEGFPVTLLEYGLASLSVLSTDVGYCPEIIIQNVNGLLVNPVDSDHIKSNLDVLTENAEMRHTFAKNLNTFVNENFSKKAIVKKAIDFYERA